jgi:hypothetical protein
VVPDNQAIQAKMVLTEVPALLASQADPDQLDLRENPVLQVSMADLDQLDPLDRSVAPDLKVNQVQLVYPVDQDLKDHKEAPDHKGVQVVQVKMEHQVALDNLALLVNPVQLAV